MTYRPIYSRLTDSQKDVVGLLMLGLSNRKIAKVLGVHIYVVKEKLRPIYNIVGCDTRLQLANLITLERIEAEKAE